MIGVNVLLKLLTLICRICGTEKGIIWSRDLKNRIKRRRLVTNKRLFMKNGAVLEDFVQANREKENFTDVKSTRKKENKNWKIGNYISLRLLLISYLFQSSAYGAKNTSVSGAKRLIPIVLFVQ